ncbi:MAG TPA: protein phosphatase 2C domain-containing protein [Chryseolinea sp.]
MPTCKVSYVCCEKLGNKEIENEDAYLIPTPSEIESETLIRLAVSDGATESSFSKEWADLLVSYFKDFSFGIENLPAILNKARDSWFDKIKNIELPWYAQEKIQYGAYASLLGVTFDLSELTWKAIAIGDSNLFVIRDDSLVKAFPITKAEEFGNTPYLLSSKLSQNLEVTSHILMANGTLETDDLIIIGTDAISAWVLSEAHKGRQPWQNLKNLLGDTGYSKKDFMNWLNNKRFEKEIKNDDTTIITVEIV